LEKGAVWRMGIKSENLDRTFAVLKPDMSVQQVLRTPQLYEELDATFA
jgi:hypothetical protein